MLSPKVLQQISFKVVAKVDQVETTETKKQPKLITKVDAEEVKEEKIETQALVFRAQRENVGIFLLESGKCLV